jgi:hypothetical protein
MVWQALKSADGEWRDIASLSDRIGVHRKTARDYLACLEAGKYAERAFEDGVCVGARMTKDGGHHAPRLRADGSVVTQGAGVNNLWRSMRMLKTFDAKALALHSSTPTVVVSLETAKSYCSMLCATGFLKVVQKASPVKDQLATYRLVRNNGPRPPMIQRVKQVYDPNNRQIYQKEGRS